MYQLNRLSARILGNLITKLQSHSLQVFKAEGYPNLFLEKMYDGIPTPEGNATCYRLAQFADPNQNRLPAPEMQFLVVGNPPPASGWDLFAVFPCFYRHDQKGDRECSVEIDNRRIASLSLPMQRAHCAYAERWLYSIHQFGYLQ